ncbi:MAG: hypothetical protein HQL57_00850 [Magnetococcales bacterium]|nr:hypothetical protein [Magnetococcales bacterium]
MGGATASDRRRGERVFCGLPMEFDGCAGNALDVNEIAVFLVMAFPCPVVVGQKGILRFVLDGRLIEERASVARVTKAGISVVSLEEVSIFPKLMDFSRSGLKFVEHGTGRTVAHFRGEFGANFLGDFLGLYGDREPGRRYQFDFRNVTGVSSSGLAMLLQLEAENGGGKDDIQIVNCNRKVLKQLALLDIPEVGISIRVDDSPGDEIRKFGVTIEQGQDGKEIVTIRIAKMFDYNCRTEFANIYRGGPRNREYILDFQDTVHVGKAAFGTMLLLNQHNRESQARNVRIINCSPKIREAMDSMKFERFFDIE